MAARLRKDLWKALGWERGDQIQGGNQGHTHLVRRTADPPNTYNYVLKELRRQDDPDRRAMFCAEVAAMGVLETPGVVTVEATNAETYKEDTELFLITPKIAGKDLEALVKENLLSLDESVRLTIAVLKILDHCHRRGVVHRDIKPCHVILRNDSTDDPVLIDFGLAHHAESKPQGAETLKGQGKGNRFLSGPEHDGGNPEANRNPVSDICQCVGLFFFMLTSSYPRILQDSDGKKPHQRVGIELLKTESKAWRRKAVTDILDVGFQWIPLYRWQSIDRLIERLENLLNDEEPINAALERELESIVRMSADQSHTARFKLAQKLAEELTEAVLAMLSITKEQAGKDISIKVTRPGRALNKIATFQIAFENKVDFVLSRTISFNVELLSNAEISISLSPYNGSLSIFENDRAVSLGNFALNSVDCCEVVRSRFGPLLAKCVSEVLGVDGKKVDQI